MVALPRYGIARAVLAFVLVAVALALSVRSARAQVGASTSSSAELQRVRTALDRYQDPIVAVHDGYLSTLGCISYPEGGGEGEMQYSPGGMGVHFLNLGLVGPALDPGKPQVLIYEPEGDKLRLVAAEWFMPADLAGDHAPSIFGRELQGPMAGHEPIMPDGMYHYDLHVWLWKDNPAGMFSPTNPALTCPDRGYSFQEAAPKMGHGH